MPRMVCVKCRRFFHVKQNDYPIEEGMWIGGPSVIDVTWQPYKLWLADLYECPGCGTLVVAGFGVNPVAEHVEPQYADVAAHIRPKLRVDDCA